MTRHSIVTRGPTRTALVLVAIAASAVLGAGAPARAQQRVLGLDVSAWQGSMSQTTWNNIHNLENRDFVFIRSSRGGTTGFYNQSNPDNDDPPGQNTLSQRYDDPYFVQNITRATTAGMFAGPYHYGRHDIIENTLNSGGIANNGTDEASHFIQMAGAWMRPGYMLPIFDLEGPLNRSTNELAQFCIAFSDRIHEEMGIRPMMYINGSYSNTLQGASSSLRSEMTAAFPSLWTARYAYQAPNYNSPEVQTAHPKDTYFGFYGPWDDNGVTHPWDFWQYASTGRLQSYNNGNNPLDFNVAHGGIDFVKDHLVPALWVNDNGGDWSTLANWNSGQTPVAPVQGPGQVPRVGSLVLPARRLPGAPGSNVTSGQHDTVILDRPNADITVTLSTGTHNIRKLYMREALDITGGSLTINYVPSPDSTPISAQFSGPVSLSDGAFSVHTLQVDAAETFTIGGGTLSLNRINLMPHGTTPATMLIEGDVNFNALSGAAAVIANGAGSGNSGRIDLDGSVRALNVGDGAAAVDLSIDVPITNGGLTKAGPGTLALNGANTYAGDTTVETGTLSLGSPFLADAADVFLTAGATLDLDFSGGPDVIDSLFIDGVSQEAGTWGPIGSTADFTSSILSGTGMLQVTKYISPFLPGDFNEDGTVDAADFVWWRRNDGSTEEYDAWRTNFGRSSMGTAASGSSSFQGSAAVPEPSTAAMLMFGGIALLAGCRRF